MARNKPNMKVKATYDMKVLHLITGLGIGGAERHLLRILPLMKRTEHVVCSLLAKKETGKKLSEQGIKVYYLNEQGSGSSKYSIFATIKNFRKIVKKEKPDLLCTYLMHADLFGRIFGRIFGIKKIICNIRTVFDEKYKQDVGSSLVFLEKLSSGLNSEYIANSLTGKQSLINNQGVKASKIVVIPNGIDIAKIASMKVSNASKSSKRKQFGLRPDDFVIVCIGRLHEYKGQIYLIRAMQNIVEENEHAKLLLIGEGDSKQEYAEEIRKLKLNKQVKMVGERVDVLEILKSSDLFVLPTEYEGMPNSVLEAMACKLPIITTNIAANKELITDNKEGLLIEPKSPQQLADKIIMLMNNKKKRDSLATSAEKKARQYDLKLCAARFEQEYLKYNNREKRE